MSLILNEITEAERRIKENDLGIKPAETIGLMARYYRQISKKSETDTKKAIHNFLQQNIENYNPVKWDATISKYVKNGKKYPLTVIDSIAVTQLDLNVVEQLETLVPKREIPALKRLLFTLICLAKYYNMRSGNTTNWVPTEYSKIFNMAHLSGRTLNYQTKMLSMLMKLGFISFNNKITNLNIHVNMVDNEGDAVLRIRNMNEIGLEYLLMTSNKYRRCVNCGNIFYKTGRKQKYCKTCAPKIAAQQKMVYEKTKRK